LDEYNRNVQIAISNAQWWRNDLERILEISRADIESLDPEGVNFSFRFSPPPKFTPSLLFRETRQVLFWW
jgi:hypothetical protein